MTNLVVDIYSFGFSYSGIPPDDSGNHGGFVFDCRFIPNPGRLPEYADLTGRDRAVIDYLENFPAVDQFFQHVVSIVEMAIENFQARGFDHLMVSFGCTGGQHRSVYFAERLFSYLLSKKIQARIHHIEQSF
ncbi:MAG: RapZ C-terminal domain-containing protein [Candidatus Zhuqueibacterota bacterium]